MSEQTHQTEGRRRDLSDFLRTRRRLLSPEKAGIETTRARRTPGLRREEVAFLADIGVKWYARLEMGDDVHPSAQTLLGIAKALQLSSVDTDYLFELAGLSPPRHQRSSGELEVPKPVSLVLGFLPDVPAVIADEFLTPLRWNAVADAIFRWSSLPSEIERNTLVRGLNDDFFQKYTGSDFERIARTAVGMFRRYYADNPSALAREVYERIHDKPVFKRFWEEQTVSDVLNEGPPIERHHPDVGSLLLHPIDFYLYGRHDLVVKLYLPADDDTAGRLRSLRDRGTANL